MATDLAEAGDKGEQVMDTFTNDERREVTAMTYVNATPCECPYCCREFTLRWCWETENLAYMYGEDGEVVTEAPGISGSRVAYESHVVCPTCGAHLRVSHELVPEFYAMREDGDVDA